MDFVATAAEVEEKRMTRGDSLGSLPDAEFLKPNHVMKLMDQPQASEFKKLELSGVMPKEPLLIPDKNRFVLFPIQHTDVSCTCLMFLCVILSFSQYSVHVEHNVDMGNVQKS